MFLMMTHAVKTLTPGPAINQIEPETYVHITMWLGMIYERLSCHESCLIGVQTSDDGLQSCVCALLCEDLPHVLLFAFLDCDLYDLRRAMATI